MNRRAFLRCSTAAAMSSAALSRLHAQTAPHTQSAAFAMVAAVDRARILSAARTYLQRPPVTLTAFPAPHSPGSLHDFYSQADYFWPNPANPNGPYINRDGQSNPANFNLHRKAMLALSIEMPALTAAWLLTGDRVYAQHACEHLRAWFVTPATRMNPNLQDAQAVQNLVTGRSWGIIDTVHLVEVARAASFLTPDPLGSGDTAALDTWFRSYIDWLQTSKPGQQERDALNNHAMCWALQVAEFARLIRDQAIREQVYTHYRTILLPGQLSLDGSFPRELARTKPYSYSIFNFDIMAGLCQSLKGLQPDPARFALPDGRGLCRAASFLSPFLEHKSTWRWPRDVEHFDSLPVRSPGLLFAGLACSQPEYLALWKTLNADPTDPEIIRNNPIRQPLLWV